MERCVVICDRCETVYTGRKDDRGNVVAPFEDKECSCGSEQFHIVSKESENELSH